MKSANLLLSTLLVILLCLVTTAFFRQSRIHETSATADNKLASAPATRAASDGGPVRMIRFVLLDTALYPRSMRVNAGLVNLAVEDETGSSEGLVVERIVNSARERVTTIRRRPGARRAREVVRLTSGQYLVYDASKPDNKANLIVEP